MQALAVRVFVLYVCVYVSLFEFGCSCSRIVIVRLCWLVGLNFNPQTQTPDGGLQAIGDCVVSIYRMLIYFKFIHLLVVYFGPFTWTNFRNLLDGSRFSFDI